MDLETINSELVYDNGEEVSFTGKTDDANRILPAIEFRDVSLAFDDQIVLDAINFRVRRGETKIVLGGAGSGKSTIIDLVRALIKHDSCQIFIDGEDMTGYAGPEMMLVRKKIGT